MPHREVVQATAESARFDTVTFEDGDRVITVAGRYGTVETDVDDGLFVSWLDERDPTPVDDEELSLASDANFRREQRWLT